MKNLFWIVICCICQLTLFPVLGSADQQPQKKRGGTVFLLGDSTTSMRKGVTVYAQMLNDQFKENNELIDVVNGGKGGGTTTMAREDFENRVLRFKPDVLVVQFGINDSVIDIGRSAKPRVSPEKFEENLNWFVDQAQKKKIPIILMTTSQLRWSPKTKAIWGKAPYDPNDPRGFNDLTLRKYNFITCRVAKNRSVPLVDIYGLWEKRVLEKGEEGVNALLLDDRMHPNTEGQKLVFNALYPVLQKTIDSLPIDKKPRAAKKPAFKRPPVPKDKVRKIGYEYWTIPQVSIVDRTDLQVVVDQEKGQYLGHPTTVLLDDQKTILCVYPKGHGKGGLVVKKSLDAGKTWSDRLPLPKSFETSREIPTIFKVTTPEGKTRLLLFSGLYPARRSYSDDQGETWSELEPLGNWGGICVMTDLEPLSSGKGHYLGVFHDDGRFLENDDKDNLGERLDAPFSLLKSETKDGGLTWSYPEVISTSCQIHLCEPLLIRSPDGKQLAMICRENRHVKNSHILFSNDEGKSWSKPREVPMALNGERHAGGYLQDGRLFIAFRASYPYFGGISLNPIMMETSGKDADYCAWIGTWNDLVRGKEGEYRIRLLDTKRGDCGYSGVEFLPDGTVVATTYGKWDPNELQYIISVRLNMKEMDRLARALRKNK